MEVYMDGCMNKLIARLDVFAEQGQTVDLKKWISFFVMDVLGELAFSRPFGVLETGEGAQMPPIHEHVSGFGTWLSVVVVLWLNRRSSWLHYRVKCLGAYPT